MTNWAVGAVLSTTNGNWRSWRRELDWLPLWSWAIDLGHVEAAVGARQGREDAAGPDVVDREQVGQRVGVGHQAGVGGVDARR